MVASLAVASLAFADGVISGPVAGYVTDSSRAQLRAILGVPGAYTFSAPLPLPDGVSQIHLAPGQDFALVEKSDGVRAVLFLKAGAVDRLAPVYGAMPSADWIAFSPAAGSALLYSSSAQRLQVLTGLPNTPRIALDQDAAMLPEQPALGALNDDGSLVLLASGTSIYRLSGDGGAQLLLSLGGIRSLTVLRNGVDVAVSDPTTGSVQVLHNAASHPEARVLASGLDGIGKIFPSWDGQSLFVAQPGARTVSSIDLASGAVQPFDSPAEPLCLTPLLNRDTFLISAKADEPGWVFYRDGMGAQVVFIPAAQ
jgi:hypothetical protein